MRDMQMTFDEAVSAACGVALVLVVALIFLGPLTVYDNDCNKRDWPGVTLMPGG